MKFTIPRDTLLEPLQRVIGAVERRQTLPILANILITVEPQRLSLLATDTEIEMIGRTGLFIDVAEPGQVTVPARKLLEICRALPDEANLDFSIKDQTVTVRSGRSRFTLATLPVSDFPNIEDNASTVEFMLKQRDLQTLIERTHFAMAQQDVRYYLNGMFFEIKTNTISTVATDGHRLALCSVPYSSDIQQAFQVIVPRKMISELGRLLEDNDELVTVQMGSHHIRLETPEYTISSKLIDGRFPAYDAVIPKGGDKHIIIDRQELKQCLTRVAIVANEKSKGICLQLRPGKILLIANNASQEEAEEELSIDYQEEDLDIGLNVTYLLDILSTIEGEQIEMTFLDANSSVLIQELGNEHSSYVVMPMRL